MRTGSGGSGDTQAERSSTEAERLRDFYARNLGTVRRRAEQNAAATSEMVMSRNHTLSRLLEPCHPRTRCVVDVGCGGGGELARWASRGASPEASLGVDRLDFRLREARAEHPEWSFVCASGEALPLADGVADVVTAFTLFSSIIDRDVAVSVAAEMQRVVGPDGHIVIYDFRVSRPGKGTRGIRAGTLRSLFPGYSLRVESTTVLPPLARALGASVTKLYRPLNMVRPLRTHMVAVLCRH